MLDVDVASDHLRESCLLARNEFSKRRVGILWEVVQESAISLQNDRLRADPTCWNKLVYESFQYAYPVWGFL